MRTTLLAALVLAAAAIPARAESPAAAPEAAQRLVSVFKLQAEPAELQGPDLDALEELIRADAAKWLSPHGYNVLTNATQLQLFEDNGIDAEKIAKACEQTCALGTARELNVSIFVNGIVRRLGDGSLNAFVRVFETKKGSLLASTSELSGWTMREVRSAFAAASPALFEAALDTLDPSLRKKREEEARRQKLEDREREEEAERRRWNRERGGLPERNPLADFGGRYVLRGGLGGLAGVLGAGLEYHTDSFAIGVGFGSYLSAGVTWKPIPWEDGDGGLYVDAHASTTWGGFRPEKGLGVTAGWDFRPVRWISMKAGAGLAWTTLTKDAPHARPLVVDLSAGLVF